MGIWLKQHPQDVDAVIQNNKQVQNHPEVILWVSTKVKKKKGGGGGVRCSSVTMSDLWDTEAYLVWFG